MYRISVFQIRPEPDLAGFMKTNPAGAGAGAGAGFQNLVQHKTTPEIFHNSKVVPNAAVCL